MSTLPSVELGVLGPLQVRQGGAPVSIPGAKPRAILTMLGLHSGSVVSADTLVELLWGNDPPRTADKALQTHISSLRRTLGDGIVLTEGTGWTLAGTDVDASRYRLAARMGRDAAAAGDTGQAVARFEEALALWRGIPELPDSQRGVSEKTRWIEEQAALVEDRADALLATGRAAEIIGELEAAVADAPLRERRWGQLMLALYRAGRQGEALAAYQRARSLLADELGVDPGPNLRRLETAIVAQDASLEAPVAQQLQSVTRAVTFLLTDIEGSTAAWEADAAAMAVALARHDELVEQVVTSRGGRLIKTRGEGDATFSVFERPSAAAAAAIELQDAIVHEPWALRDPMRIRVALHTGEVELRDGDYFGRAVNRVARLRSLATGGQILCSGATAELVIDSLPDDVVLTDLGMRQLRNLARPEHVFELRMEAAGESAVENPSEAPPIARPTLPSVLAGPGPFVGRGRELARLLSAWQSALSGGMQAVLIAGEPGVGKTRLAGEWSRQAYDQGAVVLYGRCDEDLGAPYQPFAEALRSLVPCLGADRLRGLRGVEALLALVPGLTDVLPDVTAPTRADPDTERYALFDAVVAVLEVASASAPVVVILDDLHWATKPTLLLLRHLLRFGEHARVQIVGTYRSTDLDRSHPLAAMLADLHRDGTATRLQLSGLDEDDVTAYVAEAGYDDEELARALASVTGGNPFFLIEALRHVDESGGVWDSSTLPQGVRETVSRRLSRLPAETNKALAAAAVVGSRFALDLVERVVDQDLVDAFDEASKAGIVIEEPGGRYRFNHAIVRQSLLAELPSVRRMRLHQRIATTLENEPGADDELLAELAHHYFECAWAGNAIKAVEYCRRAADQAMARLAYEGAADLYDRALHALEEIDDPLPDRDDQAVELLVARCEALLAAGDVASAAGAISQLQEATHDSTRLAAWATCFDGQLSILIHPERLDEVEAAVGAAADKLAKLGDAAGEANAHTVRAVCLARLGRIADCETALDNALTAARRAREHRRVNAVLASAPLAALWGPNPVPRAGGRCLDVVRLLRITTESPAVEATSTRCQAVLEAFRGRTAAARRMIDSARRTVTELGLRHALLEVEQFAGIVELVADDVAAAEPHLRQAYKGFRRMGLDADTAETAALLGRACLALGRDAEAEELCSESERLAGHALKASIAWRTLRAHLLARRGDHDGARRVAEAAVALAERTDALVDHGDACWTLATVLGAAGDVRGARTAADRAVALYEAKGAAALAEKARGDLGSARPAAPTPPGAPTVELENACTRVVHQIEAAFQRNAWYEIAERYAADVLLESRRKVVGIYPVVLSPNEWVSEIRRFHEMGLVRHNLAVVAVRGDRTALIRTEVGTSDVSSGAPQDESLQLYGLDEDGRIALHVWFDADDVEAATAELEAAHARLEAEEPRARRLENAASRVLERWTAHFLARDWDTVSEMLADDYRADDHRRVLNSGARTGRDAEAANMQAIAALGCTKITTTPLAARGERLVLSRDHFSLSDESVVAEMIDVVEINADNRITAIVSFDIDDFTSATEELDARYMTGEAAAHAHVWSIIARGNAALNRRELPSATPDCVSIDHRRGATFAPGELAAYLRAGIDLDQDIQTYIEVVHRLSDVGAVYTHAGQGTSGEGFDAEWRGIDLLTVDGEMVNRCEIFDEADLDTAIARFEQLSRPTPRLENEASRVAERYLALFATREWNAMAEFLAEDFSSHDRRRVVNSGVRTGRDSEIANVKAVAEIGVINITSAPIATRGDRLVLARHTFTIREWTEPFDQEMIDVLEINAEGKLSTQIQFAADDIDAAFAELDARYLAGEAAAHAVAWSRIAAIYADFSRHEVAATTPDWVSIDHRRAVAFAPGEMIPYIRAAFDVAPDAKIYVETLHRLTDLGAVVSLWGYGTSGAGFDAEWREVHLLMLDGDRIGRCEVFDETDVDAAIIRFEQLSRTAPRLENASSQVAERFLERFATRDWTAIAQLLADDYSGYDHRRVVGDGVRHNRETAIANFSAMADLGFTNVTTTVIATRGRFLSLARALYSSLDSDSATVLEFIGVVEINADYRITAIVVFEPDEIDAAFAELDARYLAGEAAAHAHTWTVIDGVFAAINRHELPATTQDWVNIDRRRGTAFAPGEMAEYIRAAWELEPDITTYIESVHRLSDLGAVVTWMSYGTSGKGFDAEWRGINVLTVEGDLINRGEVFEEADLEAAIARFEQLCRPAPRLQNTASEVTERFIQRFASRDWTAMAQMMTRNVTIEDRRHVVNADLQIGPDAFIENYRVAADLGVEQVSNPVAVRGHRIVLMHSRFSRSDGKPDELYGDHLSVIEVDPDEKIAAAVVFDSNDFDAAFAELDARYLAGEAAAYSRTWMSIEKAYAALNRRELPPTTPDWVNIDHRRFATIEANALTANIRSFWDITSDAKIRIEAVFRLSALGVVVVHATHATSQEGVGIESREIILLTVEGEKINRCEIFDEGDLDAAIARFEELSPPAPRLGNAASRVADRLLERFGAHDWDAIAEIFADDFVNEDRRRVVGAGIQHGRDVEIASIRAGFDLGGTNWTSPVIATRGQRLILTRTGYSGQDRAPEGFRVDVLSVVEIDANERIVARIVFDHNDLDAAFEELDARYLAGEGAPYAHTWSLVVEGHAAFNRRELPSIGTELVDHRPLVTVDSGDLTENIQAMWDFTPDLKIYIETVHRLSDLGAVFTQVSHGTSQAGFGAEWRIVELVTVDGESVRRGELFEEADLKPAIARFEELNHPASQLDNAASRVVERQIAYAAARNWDALGELLDEELFSDDRRRVVGAGVQYGRDTHIADMRVVTELGRANVTSAVVATRGDRLVLMHNSYSGGDQASEPYLTEVLVVIEINSNGRMVACVSFDLDDMDAAFEELDTRYLAGEAAAHARTWSVIMQVYAALNRGEMPPTTPDFVDIDHRKLLSIEPGRSKQYLRTALDTSVHMRMRITAVHRLSELGVVVTQASQATSVEGVNAEWQDFAVLAVESNLLSRCEGFDEDDLDSALARFDELSRPRPQLQNSASQMWERFRAHVADRDWDAITEMLADDLFNDDRRRVINAGVRLGRDATLASMRATADIGLSRIESSVVAIRGSRLVLTRDRFLCVRDTSREEVLAEVLGIVEFDDHQRIVGRLAFEADDLDTALQELDARYLAGEAAAHSHAWSLVRDSYAKLNRRELPATTPNWVNVDHRRLISVEKGALGLSIQAVWNLTPQATIYVEAVHELSDLGAVITHAVYATSQAGFDAEWREVSLLTFDGNLISRCEMFDEADLGTALTRFGELHRRTPRLENAATRADDRFFEYFNARNWAAFAEIFTDDSVVDDRRRVVNGGRWEGRNVVIANLRSLGATGPTTTSTVIATRGERLALTLICFANREAPDAFVNELLGIVEIDADERITAQVVFDAEDIDVALEELESRYLAGEAAAYAHIWSAVAGTYTAFNRGEMFPTTPDWVNVDHRSAAAFAPGDMSAYTNAVWRDAPDSRAYIEAVHRLDNLGAVVTEAAYGTSQQGFEAEWRLIGLSTVDGGLINRAEMFDEEDLDAAIARFDELHAQTPRLKNAASEVNDRSDACFAARDWDAMAELLTDDTYVDDRRRVVNAGMRHGRDAEIAVMRAIADVGTTHIKSVVIATRGQRLALLRSSFSGRDQRPDAFHTLMIDIVEINDDNRIRARVAFDPDDLDAAFKELDARYLAGEAAAHAHTWSAITNAYAALNRHEPFATTPDWVSIDHRPLAPFQAGDLAEYFRGTWELIPEFSIYIDAVHRLSDLGAVLTHAAYGTSHEGFDAEWRMVELITFQGDLINRGEIFEEADLDTALARFEELHPQPQRLKNTASQVADRYLANFAARDWNAMATMLANDFRSDDRRRTVGAGMRHGRDGEIADMRAIADLLGTRVTPTAIATRGERLVLSRARFSDGGNGPEPFHTDILSLVEIDEDERIRATVQFDADDIEAAINELDARYLAGEAAPHARIWSVMAQAYAAANRRELPPTAPDFVNIDHRRLGMVESGELIAYFRGTFDELSDLTTYQEVVHQLTDVGAVVTHVGTGTSQEGFDAEWRAINVVTIERGLINRVEIFDEADLDAALARFDELGREPRWLQNVATQTHGKLAAAGNRRDMDAYLAMVAEEGRYADRRKGLRHDGTLDEQFVRAMLLQAPKDWRLEVEPIAVRGSQLALTRDRWRESNEADQPIAVETLIVTEVNDDELLSYAVIFDAEDIDDALAELDTRYLDGEAAAHAPTWSVIAGVCAALNRRELAATTREWVNLDHRRGGAFEPGHLTANIRATWDQTPDIGFYIQAVHRLTDAGAVVTGGASGTSQDGFDAEWRQINILMVEGGRLSRCEMFDDSDLDVALSRFEELHSQPRRLENSASRVDQRCFAYFGTGNWAAIAELMTRDSYIDDRRRVVNAGFWDGRDVVIANMRAFAESRAKRTVTVIATRGERLALTRIYSPNRDPGQGEFGVELLNIVEIDDDERIAGHVWFDPEDIDDAFDELDTRYLAGEGAAHAHTWSAIVSAYAAFNRHEVPPTTTDLVSIDHRRGIAYAPGEMIPYIHATWDVAPHISAHAEAVHRLSDLGAVIEQVVHGTSPEGFDAQWREITVVTVDGGLLSRCEMFDMEDLDAAIARFEELDQPAQHLENAATLTWKRLADAFNRRDEDGFLALMTAEGRSEDRRKGLGALYVGPAWRQAAHALFDVAASGWQLATKPIAIRGSRLALTLQTCRETDAPDRPVTVEFLTLTEVDDGGLMRRSVTYDPDDIDAAFEELDAQYIVGEAATYSHTWSIVMQAIVALNRHELPATTPDWFNMDHREATAFSPGNMYEFLHAGWDLTPNWRVHIEAVHRLTSAGAVVTHVASGTSQDGFHAEWRAIDVFTLKGNLISSCEVFDESDLDAALARCDELDRQLPRLENDATQARMRVVDALNRRDVEGLLALAIADPRYDDRRKGLRDEGIARADYVRALLDATRGSWLAAEPMAIRGSHLALTHDIYRHAEDTERPITAEHLTITEVDDDGLVRNAVLFDPDDIDGAFGELTARWIASGEVEHSGIIQTVQQLSEAANRHDWEAVAERFDDATYSNHRQLTSVEAGTVADQMSSYRAMASLVPDFRLHLADVLALSAGRILSYVVLKGTSTEGAAIEIPLIMLHVFDGDRIAGFEVFDIEQRDLALSRFQEL